MTGAQASSLAITRGRDNAATGTVALQSDPVATAPGTDYVTPTKIGDLTPGNLGTAAKVHLDLILWLGITFRP